MPGYTPSLTRVTRLEITEAGALIYDDELLATTDHTFQGLRVEMTAGENLTFGQLCYFKSDGKFWKADADASGTTEGLLAIAVATISANDDGNFMIRGFIRDDSWNWTVGGAIYVSTDPATTGGFTQTAPSGAGDQVRKTGYAVNADVMFFRPDLTLIGV